MEAHEEPTADELLAMAYVDGELAPLERRAFAARLELEPVLAREVAELQGLHVLARRSLGPEPMDHEWRRIRRSAAHRAGQGLAWSLALVGGLGLAGWLVSVLWLSSLALVAKLSLSALLAALALWFLLALHARLRTLPYDAYREVER